MRFFLPITLAKILFLISRIYPATITVKNSDSKDVKVDIDEKHVVFFSSKYAKRSKHKRNEAITKAQKLIDSPSKYAKASSYGVMKYIKGMKLDKKTGELTQARKDVLPKLDIALIYEEEKFDGYYSIVTLYYYNQVNSPKLNENIGLKCISDYYI